MHIFFSLPDFFVCRHIPDFDSEYENSAVVQSYLYLQDHDNIDNKPVYTEFELGMDLTNGSNQYV